MKKLGVDEWAILIMMLALTISIIAINIYSGNLKKTTKTEEVTISYIESEKKTQKATKEDLGWLMVVATATSSEIDEPIIETLPATQAVSTTKAYEIVKNIDEIISPYDANEDAQMKRVITEVETTAKATTTAAKTTTVTNTAAETKKPLSDGPFTTQIVKKDDKGNVIYTATTKNVSDEDIKNIVNSEAVTVILAEKGNTILITGYVMASDVAGFRDTEVITSLLVVENVSYDLKEETETATSENKETETGTDVTETTQTSDTLTATTLEQYVIYELTPVFEEIYVDGWYLADGNKYYYYNEKEYATGYVDIGNFKYYFNETGKLCSKNCIDVSVYQGKIDWNKVKAAGIDYAIVRAGVRGYQSAKLTKDSMFDTNVTGALNAGIKVGAYVFSQAVNETEAVEEASLLITMCKNYNITGPLIIDVEEVNSSNARQNKISVEQRTKIIKVFAQMVSEAGYTPMLYTGESWLSSSIDESQISNISIWIAKWSTKIPNCNFSMWQYNPKGSIDGISTEVDINLVITP